MGTDYIGPDSVIVPAGASLDDFSDPVMLGLLDYFSWWINRAVNAKLQAQSPSSPDAVPTDNRFPWDPSTYHVQNSVPAIYLWPTSSKMVQWTIHQWGRVRDFSMLYLFEEVVGPGGISARHGLIPAVEAAVQTAFYRGEHPEYSYDGDTLGTPIWDTLGLLDTQFGSSEEQRMAPVPEIDQRSSQGTGHVVRYYPALLTKFTITELLDETFSVADVDNTLNSATFEFYTLDNDISSAVGSSVDDLLVITRTYPE